MRVHRLLLPVSLVLFVTLAFLTAPARDAEACGGPVSRGRTQAPSDGGVSVGPAHVAIVDATFEQTAIPAQSLGLCEARPKCISPSRIATLTVELDVGAGVDPASLGYQLEFQGGTTLTLTPPSSTVYFVEPGTSTLVLEFEDFGPKTTGTFDVRVRSVASGADGAWSPWASVVF